MLSITTNKKNEEATFLVKLLLEQLREQMNVTNDKVYSNIFSNKKLNGYYRDLNSRECDLLLEIEFVSSTRNKVVGIFPKNADRLDAAFSRNIIEMFNKNLLFKEENIRDSRLFTSRDDLLNQKGTVAKLRFEFDREGMEKYQIYKKQIKTDLAETLRGWHRLLKENIFPNCGK